IPLTHLCRDKCHYCTFVTVPGKLRAEGRGMFLEPDEVLDIARRGAARARRPAGAPGPAPPPPPPAPHGPRTVGLGLASLENWG
uniref:hypothetical protein n=1 Tax=Nocardia cyriacigeorgica TaxID=135487 RepID=UPI002459023D